MLNISNIPLHKLLQIWQQSLLMVYLENRSLIHEDAKNHLSLHFSSDFIQWKNIKMKFYWKKKVKMMLLIYTRIPRPYILGNSGPICFFSRFQLQYIQSREGKNALLYNISVPYTKMFSATLCLLQFLGLCTIPHGKLTPNHKWYKYYCCFSFTHITSIFLWGGRNSRRKNNWNSWNCCRERIHAVKLIIATDCL